MASRQWEWQKRKLALGLCMICGKPQAKGDGYRCVKHRRYLRAYARRRRTPA